MSDKGGHIEVAKAYVTIIPSLRGAQGAISKELDPAAASAGESAGKKAGKGVEGGIESSSSRAASKFSKSFESASSSMSEAVSSKVGGAISKIGERFSGIGSSLKASMPAFSSVAEGIGSAFSGAKEKVATALGSVKGVATGVANAVKTAFPSATSAVSNAFASLKGAASTAFEGIKSGAAAAFSGIATAAAVGGAAATAALAAVSKAALEGYAQYEQLSGGVKKLFGEEAAQTVAANAQKAYATAGMSANAYMEQATTFSASLIKGLNGDTAKAAELADVAIRAMSDNVNTFGTDAQSVQDAFNGFAKQNYTMLDNLKLGYAGTKEGMVELIKDSGVLGDAAADLTAANLDEKVSFAQIVEAIQAVQEQQGIAGTTAKEAATTIEGSVNMAKAAWSNWLTELGKDDADMEARTHELVESIGLAAQNIVPRVAQIAGAVIESIPGLLATVGETLKTAIVPMLDEITGGAASKVIGVLEPLATRLGDAFQSFGERLAPLGPVVADIAEKLGGILATAAEVLVGAIEALLPMLASAAEVLLPALSAALDVIGPVLSSVVDAVGSLASAIAETMQPVIEQVSASISEKMPAIQEVVSNVTGGIQSLIESAWPAISSVVTTAVQVIADVIKAAWPVISAIIDTAMQAINVVVTKVWPVVASAITAACNTIKGIVDAVWPVIRGVVETVMGAIKTVVETVWPVISGVVETACNAIKGAIEGIETVVGVVTGIFDGIRSAIEDPIGTAQGFIEDAINTIRGLFDFQIEWPHIPLPHFNVSGSPNPLDWLEGGLPSISIDWYAKGGFVDDATLIGVGERGGELVWPSYSPYIEKYADALADSMGERGTSGVDIHDCTFVVREESDIRAIATDLNDMINRERAGRLA